MHQVSHFIDGQRTDDTSASDLNVFNPATGEISAHVAVADAALIDHAVAIAREAASSWRESSLSQRTNILFTLRQLLVTHADELAEIITSEHGKTTADALGELARGL
jgi:malonate-semialdehyde dehydrogenase (acetylating) / methylmalonate-semialdehyde dehydrogenase